jgi:hypothetical protein
VRDLLWRLFGVPFSARERDAVFKRMLDGRTGAAAVDFVRADVTHNTEKSGALLAAEAIFLVVDLFALDQGWSKPLLIGSLLILMLCCVLAMSNLKPTLGMYRKDLGTVPARGVFNVLLRRTFRLNLALYLTFFSIVLLGAAAVISFA